MYRMPAKSAIIVQASSYQSAIRTEQYRTEEENDALLPGLTSKDPTSFPKLLNPAQYPRICKSESSRPQSSVRSLMTRSPDLTLLLPVMTTPSVSRSRFTPAFNCPIHCSASLRRFGSSACKKAGSGVGSGSGSGVRSRIRRSLRASLLRYLNRKMAMGMSFPSMYSAA